MKTDFEVIKPENRQLPEEPKLKPTIIAKTARSRYQSHGAELGALP